jgi:hypothetical protein
MFGKENAAGSPYELVFGASEKTEGISTRLAVRGVGLPPG